jgi:hypothetical protein
MMLAAVLGLLGLATGGCGGGNAVSGNVTYNGQPVENGAITFLSADGEGPTAGAQITEGFYRVKEIAPGEKIVQIEGFRDVPYAQTSAELQQQAEEDAGHAPDPAELQTSIIPADAVGNNATVEVKKGKQTLDFHLKPPAEG